MTPRISTPILLVTLAIALAGCGGSSTDTTASETTTAATTTTEVTTAATTTTEAATTTSDATTAATTTTTAAPTTISITVVDGKPDGGIARPSVDKGDHVVLVVKSDTADEVHLHGYDLSTDVEAGGTARIAFVATTQGRFEVELENSGVQLAEITVS